VVFPALYRASACAGEIVLFDRSWYNRAGVERVMGFCSPTEYLEFMREAPEIERMLVRSGIRLFKYWFSVTQASSPPLQGAREGTAEAVETVADRPASLDKWDDYTEAKEAMFFYTDTADAPWTIVKSDDKKRARLNCMQHFLSSLPYPERTKHGRPSPGSADRRPFQPGDRQCGPHSRQDAASRHAQAEDACRIGGNGLRDCLWKRRQCGASFFVRVPHTKIY
jgi:hypothetical protein